LECIRSLFDTDKDCFNDIIIVDNASSDGSVEAIRNQFPELKKIVNDKNLGYAKAVNIGVKESKSEFVIISNSDVVFKRNSVRNLITCLNNNQKVGAVGPQQLYPDGSYQYSYGDLPGVKLGIKKLLLINHLQDYFNRRNWINRNVKVKQVPYIDGAVMGINRQAFDEINGFDEDYFFYTEEADFCYKLKMNGWQIVCFPESVVTHFRGMTDKSNGLNEDRLKLMISSKIKFCKKHLSFQKAKFYIISEIVYSLNMTALWYLIHLFRKITQAEKSTPRDENSEPGTENRRLDLTSSNKKIEYNKLLFHIWLEEFNKFLSDGK